MNYDNLEKIRDAERTWVDLGDGVRSRVRVIDERYARCFSDPQYYLGKEGRNGTSIVVFENGAPVGIVMEMRFDPKHDYPAVPYLADDVLYHICGDEPQ